MPTTRVTRCQICGGALRCDAVIKRPTEATDIVMLRCIDCRALWNDERPRPAKPRKARA